MEPYDVRPASPEPATRPPAPASPVRPAEPERTAPADGTYRWRVRSAFPVVKAVGAVLFLAAGLVTAADRIALAIGVAGFLILGALALRDLVAGATLAADASGVTVRSGFAGRRHVPWPQVERVRVDRRARLGVHTEVVEIDCGDELFLFGSNQLGGEPCEDVVRRINALRSGGPEDLRRSGDGQQDEDQQ